MITFENELMPTGKPLEIGAKVLVKRKARQGSWNLIQTGRVTEIKPDRAIVFLSPEETVVCFK